MKAIVTGATGYIGSHVVKHLLDNGWDVHIVADPKFGYANVEPFREKIHIFEYQGEINSLIAYFKQENADVVFHLAAAVITNYKPEQISTIVSSNVQFGVEILEAMKHSETRLFVGTGSYWQNYNSDTYNPVDLYAASKEAFEKMLQYYVDAHDFRAITLRLFDVYGEDDKRPKLWNILKQIAGTEESIDVSPSEQILDMVHISDVCTAYECAYHLLASGKDYEPVYSVRTGSMHSLHELISLFEKSVGKKLNVNIGAKPYKEREVMKPTVAYPILPNWNPNISVENGFIKFNLEW